MIRLSSKYGPISKSFCRFGLANGSVDDDDDDGAVSGNAIDGGELISNLDDIATIPFDTDGKIGGRSLDNELNNCSLRCVGTIVWFGCCVTDADIVVVVVVVVVVDVTKIGCIRSVFGVVIASKMKMIIENWLNKMVGTWKRSVFVNHSDAST